MRVLHINNEKTWGGGERQTFLTAREQARQGIDAQIACRPGSPLHEIAFKEGIPTLPLSGAAPSALISLARAAGKYDLLHCQTGRGHSLTVLASLGRRKPTLLSRRVVFVPKPNAFNRWKYGRIQKVVCVSKCIAALLERWGVPRARLAVIYDGVPGETCLSKPAARRELLRKIGIPPGHRVVGNIAALVAAKDQATLLRAARHVIDRRRDVTFVLIGEGELRPSLTRLHQELGLGERVVFAGFIPQAQALLPALDVLAMSSSREGIPTIVLDAALAGVPVAATAAGGLPEAVLHQQTGLVVPVGDAQALAQAVQELLDDSRLVARLTEAAQARIRRDFSVSAMAAQYVEIYKQLI